MLIRARKIISMILLLITLCIGLVIYDGANFIRRPMLPPNRSAVDYILEPGASIFSLARDLKRLGMLERPLYLVILAKWCHLSQHLKAGEYRFLPGIKPLQLLQQIAQGKVLAHQLTIVEGWTFERMMQAIRAEPRIKQTLINQPAELIMAKLGAHQGSPEGLFFPDSYRYTRGTTDLAILQVAYQAMNTHLLTEWQRREEGLPYRTPYEALIVASLIEKETGLDVEKPMIAGVIVNRLKKQMLLQIDPTIIYGLGNTFSGRLHSADLKKDTPFNTYLHLGLPPTPIALPGLASIRAALHPQIGNKFYFVATGNGNHHFSANLNEHKRAVQNYLRQKRENLKREEKAKHALKPISHVKSGIKKAPAKQTILPFANDGLWPNDQPQRQLFIKAH